MRLLNKIDVVKRSKGYERTKERKTRTPKRERGNQLDRGSLFLAFSMECLRAILQSSGKFRGDRLFPLRNLSPRSQNIAVTSRCFSFIVLVPFPLLAQRRISFSRFFLYIISRHQRHNFYTLFTKIHIVIEMLTIIFADKRYFAFVNLIENVLSQCFSSEK